MGRKQSTLAAHCKGSHFTWEERLRLQYYYAGANGWRKERSATVLGKIFQKSPRTISRELERGMVEHMQSDIPFIRLEYNADHAQTDAERKMEGKGPSPKSGRHHALVRATADLILKRGYSPYAVIQTLGRDGLWPEGLTVCEKALYNWIEAGDIPDVTIGDLPRSGKMRRQGGSHGTRRHSRVGNAIRSIEKRPKEALLRMKAGHWEGDTVYSTKDGSRQCLPTMVERRSRMSLVLKMPNRSSASVKAAFDRIERQLGSVLFGRMFLSVTLDNGSDQGKDYESKETRRFPLLSERTHRRQSTSR